jgi:drug/metabolite transporter (DMT)-like permease
MVAALLWASTGTAGKILFQAGVSPVELVRIRVTCSTLILAVIFGVFCRHLLRLRPRDILYFILFGGVAMTLVQLSYFFAISKIQVAAAILLQYLAPILVAIFSMCFWSEKVTAVKLLSLFLAMAGCYLVVGGYNMELLHLNREGIMWGLVSAVCFASCTLLGERGMYYYPPWTVIFYAFLFASVALNIVADPKTIFRVGYTPLQWLSFLYIIVFGTIVAFWFYYTGINTIRATRAIITATLEPISAALMAFIVLGEVMEPLQMLGGIFVISSITLLQLHREHDALAPALIRSRNTSDRNTDTVQERSKEIPEQ